METSDTLLNIDAEKVLVVESSVDWEKVEPLLIQHLQLSKVLGFDCEWVSDRTNKYSHPVSLLQLATISGLCVLIRLHLFLSEIPVSLQQVLSDKSILKIGVACQDDSIRLAKDYGLHTYGCVDLRHLALRCGFNESMGFGLKTLSAAVLNISLDKHSSIRASNWEAPCLSKTQIVYGAKDAVVGAFLFWRLISIKNDSGCFLCPVNKEFSKKASSFCQGLIDVPYKSKGKTKGGNSNGSSSQCNPKEPKNRAYVVRQSPLYHNCQMMAPDGQLLCTCDIKKASWYLEKGLAVKISENPLKLKLTFEPSGRPIEEQNYYTQDKLNICVVCGAGETYIRKSVIPHEYRKYFPPVMKEHRSHDVLLMCLRCHQRSNIYDQTFKTELVQKCNAPLDTDKKFHNDENIQQVKSAARALLNQDKGKSNIPETRLQELRKTVCDFYGVTDVSPELLKTAKDLTYKVRSETYIPHGEKVVEYISQHEGLIEFERMWREKFLHNMQPQFLPAMWSIDHHHYQLTSMEYKMKVASQTETENDEIKFLKS